MRYVKLPGASRVDVLRACPRVAVRLIVPVFAALAALVALPSLNAHPAQAVGGGLLIHATDFSFQTDGTTVTPGPVHIEFFNDSKDYTHEVIMFNANQQAKLDEFLAAKRAGQDVEESDFLTIAGAVEDVPAGQSIAFDANLPAGEYVLACFVTSPIAGQDTIHYDLGMHTGLVAGAAVAPAPTTAPAPTQAAAPAVTNVQAPNAGTGPTDGGSGFMWIAAIVAVGALAVAGGGLMRRASHRR